jgi:Pyridoxamine 5'-phosphate oxidase
MRWSDLERGAPRLAARARERLVDPGVLLVATIRRDGSPRLSPVEPLLFDGDLWLSMIWRSRKAVDIVRDNRVLLHSIVQGPQDPSGEIKVRGRQWRSTTATSVGATATRWSTWAGAQSNRISNSS